MSHVPRVCASGRGNTSSRTPLIIFVFGEFGASVEGMLKKTSFVARKISKYPKLPHFTAGKDFSSSIVDEINPYLVRPNRGNSHCKTKCSRYFVHNVSTFFSLTSSLARGTQD